MRIVSLNLCTDQLLMLLADRTRIASITHLAFDPGTSAMAAQATGLTANHGFAEEILPLDPDLVLAGAFSARPTVFLLRRLGYRVVEIPVASDFDDIRANIRTLAAAIGARHRGEALIKNFDQQLEHATAGILTSDGSPVGALHWANSYSSGAHTLADAVVQFSGFRNLASELGISGPAQLPLERLIASDPDILIIGRVRDGAALAHETLRHPAMRRTFDKRKKVSIPDNLWVCGTPFVAEAVRRLSIARRALSTGASGQKTP